MNVGTKSLLFGVHQFALHPLFVALAWRQLYGFPCDPRIWVAFIVHDWGYWGLDEIDGPKGDQHPELGAAIMHRLFDTYEIMDGPSDMVPWTKEDYKWQDFCLYHSRFLAKKYGSQPSKLCMADKLATNYYPTWLFILLGTLSGELKLFMNEASKKKHAMMGLDYSTPWTFVDTMKTVLRKYVTEHKDGQEDTVT